MSGQAARWLPHLEDIFPDLAAAGYGSKSPNSTIYNCIAYAAGDETTKWAGYRDVGYHWPEKAKEGHTESKGTWLNGINLSPRSLSPQAFSEDVPWLRHAVVLFGPSLDDTGFEAVRAMGNDFQFA